jgi:hypothetical protein
MFLVNNKKEKLHVPIGNQNFYNFRQTTNSPKDMPPNDWINTWGHGGKRSSSLIECNDNEKKLLMVTTKIPTPYFGQNIFKTEDRDDPTTAKDKI